MEVATSEEYGDMVLEINPLKLGLDKESMSVLGLND